MMNLTGITAFQGLETLRNRKDPDAIRVAAKEMESLFAYELIKAMREASEEATQGIGKGVYTTLFDMELARLMAERGFGLKEMLLKGLGQRIDKAFQGEKVDGLQVRDSWNHGFKDNSGAAGRCSIAVHDKVQHDQDERGATVEDKGLDIRMPVIGKVSSYFGMRNHPIYGDMRFHRGIDIAASEGTDIYPLRPGRVVFSGLKGGYGNMVIIDHGDGYITKYAHNEMNLVRENDYVDSNTVIAKVGNTGLSTGPHLHFEVTYKGQVLDPIKILALGD